MAYSVNGKIYTDHPLMDEIVDCCKTILDGIVVKNDALALSYETDESLEESREFMLIIENKIDLINFPFTYQMLASFTDDGVRVFSDAQIEDIMYDPTKIPDQYKDSLLEFCRSYYIENYDERNNYYRSLAGLPPYPGTVYNIKRERSDSQYNIYIYESDFPSDYDTSHIDFTKPIHEQSANDISILETNGVLDSIIAEYRGFNYSYLRYLGYKSISIYKARKAIKWEILYIPTVEQLVQQRFEELYNINRNIYLKRTYQDAMSLGSNHYDESLILLLLCQTFNDLVVDVPEWYIRRDIFDIRSVQYFLESFGVEFFEEIPLKYQVAIVKNLNKLIKYKSSAKNNNDIIDIFDLDGTYIYKYFLYKKKKNETSSEDIDNYDLEFIKAKQGDSFDKYIENNIYRYKYDDITLHDKFWDGVYKEWNNSSDKSFKERLHEDVRDDHIKDVDYTVEGTKYMSIDYEIDMSQYKYQVQYFYNMILDSGIITDDLKIIVPSISSSTELEVSNLFILLYLLTMVYDGFPDTVIRPEDRTSHLVDMELPRVEYYEQLYKDDGDFDDYIKWNIIFGTYVPPADYDTNQFDFGLGRKYTSLDDDGEFEFGDIQYDLSYLVGDYDFEESLTPEEIDEGWDFVNPTSTGGTEAEEPDNHMYDLNLLAYEPDEGWNFNDELYCHPDDFFRRYFKPKHWEVKTYIENRDPVATSQGYNSYPVWAENYRDWAKRRVPEVLTTSYNRINGFNNTLEPRDIDNLFEVVGRRIKKYNFDRGYKGYSYKAIYGLNGELNAYEITYEYDEDVYTHQEYIDYVCYPLEPKYDPSKETIEEFNQRYAEWEQTLSEEAYNNWKAELKEDFMAKNPRGPLGIAGFRIPKRLSTFKDVTDTFDVNTACYNDLSMKIYNSDNRDEYIVLKYVFNTLFTKEFDYNFYKVGNGIVDNLSLVLKNRSYILYNFYKQIISEDNITTLQANIRTVMNDIIATLEYYLSGDNIKFIYSSFSVSSFSNLIKYLYLMINFFKSWKVYFLDPVVTINTNDIMESGNNYGCGMDSIAEVKLNYWHEDKEFKRDIIDTNLDFEVHEKANEQVKEVLDVYGRFDPDPEDDYDFDGYLPEEASAQYRDIDGGVVDGRQNIPYRMINGGKSYDKLIDIWDLDGAGPLEMQEYLTLNGGGVYHPEDLVTRNSFDNLFTFNINGGNPGTNQFWTKTLHTKIIDRQIEHDVLVSDREANVIVEDDNGLYIKQAWASWSDFNEMKDIGDQTYSYINYMMEVLYEDLLIITDEDLLEERINELVDEEFANMRKVVQYAKNIDYQKENYKKYVDDYIEELENTYGDFSPYSWDNF